jgi:acyl-CoA synthetase (AMP-forming)/AMP-acid ligase II
VNANRRLWPDRACNAKGPQGGSGPAGRKKDLIIRGGHNIDPKIIEEALAKHPAVALAAAIGRPDAQAGELPVAYVQLKPNATATVQELMAFAAGTIPERAAIPKHMHSPVRPSLQASRQIRARKSGSGLEHR